MISVHFETPPGYGFSIPRVERELKRHAPECVRFVPADCPPDHADVFFLQYIGRDARADYALARSKPYVVLLYCFTPGIDLRDLPRQFDYELLKRAACAYSFHALADMGFSGRFLLAPLGVDPATFYPEPGVDRRDTVMATGYVSHSEALYELYLACVRVGGRMIHVGGDLVRECGPVFSPTSYVRYEGVTDQKMRELYSSCRYVSGLRRFAGFELPVLEGLLCGSRPVCFDNMHYTRWFRDFAVFVPETHERLVDDLAAVFQGEYRPVTEAERARVAQDFNWPTIARRFWDFVLGCVSAM